MANGIIRGVNPVAPSGLPTWRGNEPGGLTTYTENAMTWTPTVTNSEVVVPSGVSGATWRQYNNAASNWIQLSRSNAPRGGSTVSAMKFYNGHPQGYAPGTLVGAPATSVNPEIILIAGMTNGGADAWGYDAFYECGWVQFGGYDAMDKTFSNQTVGCKAMGFWGTGGNNDNSAPGNDLIHLLRSPVPDTGFNNVKISSGRMRYQQQNAHFQDFTANVTGNNVAGVLADGYVPMGEWVFYEIYCALNTDGLANGIFRAWHNGVKTHEFTNVTWRDTATGVLRGFYQKRMQPTWGGGGGTPTLLDRDEYIMHNGVYISVGNPVPVQVPTQVAVQAGNSPTQSVTAGTAVPIAPSVLVRDVSNNPIKGIRVTWAIGTGGGSVTGASGVTNASGIATLGSWTLGGTPGSNTVIATVSAAWTGVTGNPVTFTATGT